MECFSDSNHGSLQLLMQNGDHLHVPAREEEPVFVMGEVKTPRSVTMYNGALTLAQALSDSGGMLMNSADSRSVYVFRSMPDAKNVRVYHLDAKSPLSMLLADRFRLRARDVVYVDAGPLVRWNRVLSLILPSLNVVTGAAAELKYLSK